MLQQFFCYSIIFFCYSITLGRELLSYTETQFEITKLCPEEKAYCLTKAVQGQCYGKSVKAETLKRTCSCACDAIHFKRIQSCCKALGRRGMAFCLPLCKYNTTMEELSTSLGYKCVSQLTTWAYCAADVSDNTLCCKQKGVPPECLSFCKGDVPTCDLQSIFYYQSCLRHIQTITQCHVENLASEPRWNSDWTARCDWDGSE